MFTKNKPYHYGKQGGSHPSIAYFSIAGPGGERSDCPACEKQICLDAKNPAGMNANGAVQVSGALPQAAHDHTRQDKVAKLREPIWII